MEFRIEVRIPSFQVALWTPERVANHAHEVAWRKVLNEQLTRPLELRGIRLIGAEQHPREWHDNDSVWRFQFDVAIKPV